MSAEQQRWLASLYEANFAAVFRRCGVLLKSAEDAADAAHEVFLIAVNSLAPKTEEKRARAWLLTVAHNHCLDILRRRKRFGRALVVLGANEASDDLEAGGGDRGASLPACRPPAAGAVSAHRRATDAGRTASPRPGGATCGRRGRLAIVDRQRNEPGPQTSRRNVDSERELGRGPGTRECCGPAGAAYGRRSPGRYIHLYCAAGDATN